jgi:Phage integrase family
VCCLADGRPVDPRNFIRHFDRMLQQAGLPHMRFRDARPTFTTVMLDLKASPKAVQALLGHSKIATTMDIYAHGSSDVMQPEMGRLNNVLRSKPRSSDAAGAIGESNRHLAEASPARAGPTRVQDLRWVFIRLLSNNSKG